MELVIVDKVLTTVVDSKNLETVVTDSTTQVLVKEELVSTVSVETVGNIVHEEHQKETVVQGGVQGPPGIPGTSTQFEYVVAGQVLGGNRAVTVNGLGTLTYPDVTSEQARVYGVTTHSAIEGEVTEVQITGTQTEITWSWTPNQPVFVGQNGVLTQTPPVSGQVLVVGFSQTPTKLFIDRQPPIFMG